jgi:hypothetical protein
MQAAAPLPSMVKQVVPWYIRGTPVAHATVRWMQQIEVLQQLTVPVKSGLERCSLGS